MPISEAKKLLSIKHSPINYEFKKIIAQIESESSDDVNPRGLLVKESILTSISIDPFYPCVDFKSRPFNWKYFAGELAWYLSKSRQTDLIDNFSNFWKSIKNKDGTVNSNYGNILLSRNDEIKANSYSLKDSIERNLSSSQMAWVVNSLKKDKFSRQAIAYIGGSKFQYEGNKDFVCTQYLLFFIRDNKLNVKVQMRSNDVFYGLTYDAPWFSTIHQNIYLELLEIYPDLKLGKYVHCSDNSHFYERHFKVVESIKSEKNVSHGPKIQLKNTLWTSSENGNSTLTKQAIDYLDTICNFTKNFSEHTDEDYITALTTLFKITK